MESAHAKQHWTICPACHGQGKTLRRPSPKRWGLFKNELAKYELRGGANGNANTGTTAPQPPLGNLDVCPNCGGSGLVASTQPIQPNPQKYPTLAIIGGGIGGVALAVACQHRGIPYTLYERDASFDARSQGYGLTLQQASKAVEALGITSLDDGVTSTRHVVHTPDGKIIGEWGLRKWRKTWVQKTGRKNVHIARQTLRSLLLQEVETPESIQWGHKLLNISPTQTGAMELTFQAGDQQKTTHADVVVGADGIYSMVRKLTLGEDATPLQYLGCIVILGICPLKSLGNIESPLLDSATVFQTVNGHERIYMMPYDADTIMWQLSFPLSEDDAQHVSAQSAGAMKEEALKRLDNWHSPVPQILAATLDSQITGYPVYDRKLFDPMWLREKGNVTLLGDAAHPMSPFKGQGANQALLDALALARKISVVCDSDVDWRKVGIRESMLNEFEQEIAERSASKVQDSRKAVDLLHSPAVLHEGDAPRGRGLNID
ncbi:MAG TPA: FAD-dependent monooxygenase [Candidatus Paceibacterota bacterium]